MLPLAGTQAFFSIMSLHILKVGDNLVFATVGSWLPQGGRRCFFFFFFSGEKLFKQLAVTYQCLYMKTYKYFQGERTFPIVLPYLLKGAYMVLLI